MASGGSTATKFRKPTGLTSQRRHLVARCIAAFLLFATLVGGTPVAPIAEAGAQTAFGGPAFTTNTNGDIVYVANTLMTCPASAACTDAQSNQFGTAQANNSFNMIDIDVDGDPSTFNSSSAEFTLSPGANVQWAGLFWGATSRSAARGNVKFDTPASVGYLNLSAPAAQVYSLGSPYQGWVDVTTEVQAGGSGTYTVADVQHTNARGQYAGWSLVVVVEDPAEPFRNLSVFPGLERVSNGNPVDITVSGFLTPPVGPVLAEVGFVTYEGDERYSGDYAELNGVRLGDALNPTTNFFNSRISDGGNLPAGSNPNYFDQLGFDAKIVNTVGVVPPGATSATVTLGSRGDVYYQGVVTTAIDIFVPNLVLDLEKSVDDVNGGNVNVGDNLTYEISFSNQGEDAALDTILTDAIPAGTTYVPGSARITSGDNVGTANAVYNAGTDEVEFYLGTGASAGTGGRVAPFLLTGTTYTVEFDVTVDPGTEGSDIDNVGELSYTAETLGEAFTSGTNIVTVPVVALANVVFEGKADTIDPVIAGNATVYELSVSNDGPSLAENTTVVDTLPAGFVFDASTSSPSCSVTSGTPATGQTVTCVIGSLAAGGNASVLIGVNIDGATAATTFTNNAQVTTTTPETTTSDNFGRESTTVRRLVDLGVTKTATPDPAQAGGQITYTLTATNAGPSDAQNVELVDGLPAGASFVSVDNTDCTHASGTISCNYAELAAGDTVVVTIVVDVAASTPDGSVLSNVAKIGSDDPEDPAGAPNDATVDTVVGRAADLQIDKTASGPFIAGTTVLFDLAIQNNGASDATNLVITDALPAGTTFDPALSSSGCALVGGDVECSISGLAAGASTSVTIAVELPATLADGATLSNTADVSADETDPVPANNEDDVDFTVERIADLGVIKSVSPDTVAAGSNLTFTIDVTNEGPSEATGVTVTDTLPAGVTLVSAPGCSGSATLSCTVGTLAPGATAQFTVVVAVPAGAADGIDLTNTADVAGNETDPEPTNNSSRATATVVRSTQLEITKIETSGFPDPALAGTGISWDIVVTNLGTSEDTDVVIDDDLSALPLSNIAATITGAGNSCTVIAGVVSCSVPVLPGTSGANSITLTITADLDADIADGTVLVNNATADGTFSDPADAVEETTVNRRADLQLDKSGPATIVAGSAATWTVTVTNAGPGQADNVTITDVLPASATYVSHSIAAGSATCSTTGTLVCDAGDLAPGATVTILVTAEIADTDPDGSTVANTAFVETDTIDPDPTNDQETVTSDIVRSADLSITKTALDNPVIAGETVSYTVTVTNAGPSIATDVTVTDPIPAGLTFDAAASDASCSVVGGDVVCLLGTVDADDPAVDLVLTFVVDANQPVGTITNSVSVDATEDDPDTTNNAADEDIEVETRADLGIVKGSAADPIVPGTPYSWDIAVTNDGPSNAVNAVVTDTLPVGVTFDPATSSPSCSVTAGTPATGQTITCTLGTVTPGQTVDLAIGGDVDPAATGTLTNAAVVSSDTTDPNATNDTASDDSPTVPLADLSVAKTGDDAVVAGESIAWSIAVTNDGPSDAVSTVITDTLPVGITFDPATSDTRCVVSAGTPATGQTVTCTLGTIAPGTTIDVAIGGDLDPTLLDGSTITNEATVSSDTIDPDPSNDDDDHDASISRTAELSVTKVAAPAAVVAGAQVTYTLSLTNDGPSAASIATLADPLAPGLSLDSFALLTPGSCSGAISCSVTELLPGESLSVELTVTVSPTATAGTITNTATGSAPEDPDGASASEDITVSRSADLAVTKTASPTSLSAGERVTFTVTVDNLGLSQATNVTVTDPVPAGLTYVPAASDPACALVGGDIVCALGTILPSDTLTSIDLVFDVGSDVPGGDITNTASASADENDPDPTNNTGADDITVDNLADLSLTKTAPAAAPVPGTPYVWSLSVTNDGPSDAVNTVVSDTLPAGVTFDPATSSTSCVVTAGTPATGQTITCTLNTLTPGAVIDLAIGVDIDPSITGSLANSASVAADTTDPDPDNNADDVTGTLAPAADLGIAKTGPADVIAGNSISWDLAVTNDGPSDAVNTVVTDTLPAGITFDPAASSTGCVVSAGTPASGQTITCTLNTLAPSATVALTIGGDVDPTLAAGPITNTAAIESDTDDTDDSNNADDAETDVDRRAELAVTKVASAETVVAGDTVTYTLTLTNAGPSSATNPVLSDALAAELSLDSFALSTPGSCTGAISCTVASLAPGASLSVEVVTIVDPTVADGTTVTNIAVGTAPEDPDGASATETIDVIREADLAVTKTSATPELNAGERATFTITVDNLGASQATNVTITDPVPAGLIFVAAASDSRCSLVGGDIVCDLGTVQPSDAAISVDLVFDVETSQPISTIVNTASAAADENDPDDTNDSDSDDIDVDTLADLSLTKSSSADPVVPGTPYSWDLVVSNDGPSDATGVVVTDTLPAGVTFDAATSDTSCAVTAGTPATGQTITCTLNTLTSGQTVGLTIGVDVDPAVVATPMVNTASVEADTNDPTPGDNSDTDSSPVAPAADLGIDKVAPAAISAGTPATWQLIISNDGPSDAVNTVVTDTLPAGVTFDAGTSSTECVVSAGTPATGQTITCTLNTLAPGATVTLIIGGDVDPGVEGTLTNTAAVASDTDDPNTDNDTDAETTTVDRVADLSVTKSADPATVTAGGQVVYTVTVTNAGPATATDVEIVDDMAPGLSPSAATPLGSGACSIIAGVVTCTVATLTVGETATFEITADVDSSVADGATITNTVEVDSSEEDPDGATATEDVDVQRIADLAFDKTLTTADPIAGEPISFDLVVTNDGPSDATNIVISDPLPAGTTFDAAASSPLCSLVGSTVECTIASLTNGATTTVPVVLVLGSNVADGSTIVNAASVNGAETDPNADNDADDAEVEVDRLVDLSMDKVAPAAAPVPGTQTSWNLEIANAGPSDAANIVVTDTLPAGLTLDPATSDSRCSVAAGTPATGQTITCLIPVLADGGTDSLIIGVDVDPGITGDITNTASVSSDEDDADPSNNADSETSMVAPSADVSLIKTAVTDPVVAGESVEYTIEVTNDGPSDAADVVVNDVFPSVMTFDDADSDTRCDLAGTAVGCNLGIVAAGATTTLTVVFDLAEDAVDGSTITNVAFAESSTDDPNTTNNSDQDESPVTRSADVFVAKTGPATLIAGGTGTYTIAAGNAGPSTATGVLVADAVPAGMTIVGITGPAFCTFTASALSCPAGTLADGETFTVTVDVAIDSSVDDLASLANNASIAATEADPDTDNNGDQVQTTIERNADLATTKTILTDPIVPGEPALFEITVTNNGLSDATGVTVADALAPGLTFRADLSSPACSPGVSCFIASLPAGESVTFTVGTDVAADLADGSTVANTATASADENDPDPTNDAGSDTAPVVRSADLGIVKSGPAVPTTAGTQITWTLDITNDGPSDATGVIVSDSLPAGTTFNAAGSDSRCSIVGGPIECTIGSLANGATDQLTILVDVSSTLAAGAMLTNSASIAGNEDDPSAANDSSEHIADIERTSGLSLTKIDVIDPVVAGETIAWDLAVENLGPSASDNVTITDTLPIGVTFDPATSATECALAGGTPATGQTIVCDVGTLDDGESATVRIAADLDQAIADGVQLTNTAVATGDDAADGTAEEETTIDRIAEVTVTKVAETSPIVPGVAVIYTITVVNNGPSQATDIELIDVLPAGATLIAVSGPVDCTDTPGTVTCPVGVLDRGASAAFTLELMPASFLADGDDFVNQANVSAAEDADGDSATSTEPIERTVDLAITKTPSSPTAAAGTGLTYDLTVANGGPSDAANVVVADVLPDGMTFDPTTSSASCAAAGQAVTCVVDTLAADASITFVVGVLIGDTVTGELANNAAVSSDEPNTNPDPTATSVVDVGLEADLELVKTGPSTVLAGEPITYTITVTNQGPSLATNVVITDVLPAELSPAELAEDCSTAGTPATITCELGDLPLGESVAIDLIVTLDPSADRTVRNVASVESDANDPNPASDVSTTQADIDRVADLDITKAGPTIDVIAGGLAEWTIDVTNAGPSTATDVVVTDTLPAGAAFVISGSSTSCLEDPAGAAGVVDCDIAELAVGETVTLTIMTLISDNLVGTIENAATAASNETDPDGAETTADLDVRRTNAALSITKVVTTSNLRSGGQSIWTITLTNDGPENIITPIEITDDIPEALTYNGHTIDGGATCELDGQQLTCDLAEGLAAGDSVTLDLTTTTVSTINSVENTANARVAGLAGSPDGLVVVAATAAAQAPPTGGPLAFTGSSTMLLLAIAAGLLLLGGTAILTAKRHRSATVSAE